MRETLTEGVEIEEDLPSEALTHIAATYPFLNDFEYNAYMDRATSINTADPIKEIEELVKLLNNPHATFKKVNPEWNHDEHETNSDKLPSSEMLDNVLYMKIPTLSRITLEDLEKVYLPYAQNSSGLIIDLRENGGGSELAARSFAEKYLITKGNHVAGTNIKLAPEEDLKLTEVTANSQNENYYDEPIVILMSGKTFSSAERFVAIMKAGTDCILIGQETRGGSANPIQTEIELEGNKYILSIPTWRFFLEGKNRPIEETKIQPDIQYDKDDIVEYARNYILKTNIPRTTE